MLYGISFKKKGYCIYKINYIIINNYLNLMIILYNNIIYYFD
jgi:hypothetical protein